MMTRKDYVNTADILNNLWRNTIVAELGNFDVLPLLERAIVDFAEMFESDNPRFDRDRFLAEVTR